MTTVAQLIEHLKTLPQDAIVQCLVEHSCFHDSWTSFENLNLIGKDHVYLYGNHVQIGEK